MSRWEEMGINGIGRKRNHGHGIGQRRESGPHKQWNKGRKLFCDIISCTMDSQGTRLAHSLTRLLINSLTHSLAH